MRFKTAMAIQADYARNISTYRPYLFNSPIIYLAPSLKRRIKNSYSSFLSVLRSLAAKQANLTPWIIPKNHSRLCIRYYW